MVASTDGSPTWTGWKRRSRAASFSTCLRYSSRVVAPIMRSSPRASMGLSMLEASMAPSAAPAPTTVCISSMKVTTWPSASAISLRTAFSRSSNSPRYLEPATIEPRSRATMRRFLSPSGTSPSTMRRARPSTMAVLPTPGSPMRTGLFLVRRERTWMTRRISSSRPMTGSSLPVLGHLGEVAAVALEGLVGVLGRLAGDPVAAPDVLEDGEEVGPGDAPTRLPSLAARARSRCSVDRYSSRSSARSWSAASSTARISRPSSGSRRAVGLGHLGQRGRGPGCGGRGGRRRPAGGRVAPRRPPGRGGPAGGGRG